MESLCKGVVTWSFDQYRSNAEKEYNSFWMALFRELLQNSNDAGSTKIQLEIDDKKGTIICIDDGNGMSLDVIQGKLLVIGGTFKDGKSVGGLGKAKELLFFSQPRWSIRTDYYFIHGVGGEYEIFEKENKFNGTYITLYQEDCEVNWKFIESYAKSVVRRSSIKAHIYVNGLRPPRHSRGKYIKDIDQVGRLYLAKTRDGKKITDDNYLHVSVNGCWMFDRWIGEHEGRITVDIDSSVLSPLDGLTANRDGLKNEYAIKVDQLVKELIVDKAGAVRKRDPEIYLIKGTGSVSVIPSDREIDELTKALEKMFQSELTESNLKELVEDHLALERLEMLQKSKPDHLMEELKCYTKVMNYEPDFVVIEDRDNGGWSYAKINKFMKTQKAATIARVWTETLKQIFWDNKIAVRFTAGFIFDKDTEALRMTKNRQEYYLINPRLVPPTGIQNKVVFMNYMRTAAIHEITHKFQVYHDEYFMSRYHEIESKTWPGHRIYARIGKLR